MGLVLFPTVRFQRKDDVEQHEEREYERLDEADEELERDEWQHEAWDEQERGQHREHDLAAPDVAPKAQCQREDSEKLAEQFDRSDEDEHHTADERSFLERREVDPTSEVAKAVLPNTGGLVPDESGKRETEVGVVVGRRCVQQLDLTDERDAPQPVRDEREQEERPKQRQVAHDSRS